MKGGNVINKKETVFLNPLNDIVFKTLCLRADEDLKIYFNRISSYISTKNGRNLL